jgi:hypothetical protein
MVAGLVFGGMCLRGRGRLLEEGVDTLRGRIGGLVEECNYVLDAGLHLLSTNQCREVCKRGFETRCFLWGGASGPIVCVDAVDVRRLTSLNRFLRKLMVDMTTLATWFRAWCG